MDIGTILTVRKDLANFKICSFRCCIISEMHQYAGKKVKIRQLEHSDRFMVTVCDTGQDILWSWTPFMFEEFLNMQISLWI